MFIEKATLFQITMQRGGVKITFKACSGFESKMCLKLFLMRSFYTIQAITFGQRQWQQH